ncbi:uncharacterized protein CPUR_04446 [Claviceps purpurea 20.1]|uniref:ATP-dependent DNA helicase n=1 Tax=Claviceps purpurea (strain 20.1) TaxID=1111077 RepID=M1VW38_CLAP2|nr:uncharacterized protein CPUR_04446 [Claviceps purpurea 20.1]
MQITLMTITDVLMSLREATTAENEQWYIILDEKSMIGLRTLYNVDQRLCQVNAKPDTPFGGMSVLLSGDFVQLPPVFDKPLYKRASADRQQKSMPK